MRSLTVLFFLVLQAQAWGAHELVKVVNVGSEQRVFVPLEPQMSLNTNASFYASLGNDIAELSGDTLQNLKTALPEAEYADGYARLPWVQVLYYRNSVGLYTIDGHLLNLFSIESDQQGKALRFGRPQISPNQQWIAFVKYTSQKIDNDFERAIESELFVVDSRSGELLWRVPNIIQFEWVSDSSIFGTDMMAKAGLSIDVEHLCPRALTMSDAWKLRLLNVEAKSDSVLQSWPRLFDPCGSGLLEWADLIWNPLESKLYLAHRSSEGSTLYRLDLEALIPLSKIADSPDILAADGFTAADELGRIVFGTTDSLGVHWNAYANLAWSSGFTKWSDAEKTFNVLDPKASTYPEKTILGFPFGEQALAPSCVISSVSHVAGSLVAVTTQCNNTYTISVWETL